MKELGKIHNENQANAIKLLSTKNQVGRLEGKAVLRIKTIIILPKKILKI